MALEEGEPRESASGREHGGVGGSGGRKGRTLYFIRRDGAVVARTEEESKEGSYPVGASIGEPSLFR